MDHGPWGINWSETQRMKLKAELALKYVQDIHSWRCGTVITAS